MQFDLCIGTWASDDNEHKTADYDIIAVRPHGWQWGRRELEQYLIVPAENLEEIEAQSLALPWYENGTPLGPDESKWLLHPEGGLVLYQPTSAIIEKHRFQLPLDNLKQGWRPDLSLSNVKAKKTNYQPLLRDKHFIDMSEKVAICYDKQKQSFKYTKVKTSGQL